MRFFTPELYLQFNSSNDDIADRADEQWEAAIQAYREHLTGIHDRMPYHVRKLADLCLHDAAILAGEEKVQPLPFPDLPWPVVIWSAVAIISVKQEDQVLHLTYFPLGSHSREFAPQGLAVFQSAKTLALR